MFFFALFVIFRPSPVIESEPPFIELSMAANKLKRSVLCINGVTNDRHFDKTCFAFMAFTRGNICLAINLITKCHECSSVFNLSHYFYSFFCGDSSVSESDYLDIANQLGCKVAAIKAVADVESSGDAFFSNGKPKILFEAHIFARLTNHKYDQSHPSVSSRTWNRSLYTGGSQEYARLEIAMSLDTSEALKSTSWGRFQIMGFNYSESGFTSVEAFVKAMFSSERKQLDAFVSFVKNKGLEKYLITLDWASFAKGYNGSQYEQNKYDIKLHKAFEKYDKK
ncbi:hypothetical protein Sfri_2350 [Shewanella frigidimarina NCIMB 400]|uniref:N-acetylmuramidase domain-containing protein n=3 Tax=Shewanella TaxID=22 RepID=Q080W9_SHEFN|nr:hypothetical protein Sfri_2350 [Shewanella frigidimarina NCIMB 400]